MIRSVLNQVSAVFPFRQIEMDEIIAKHEREKNLLTDENRKLTVETDKVQ